MTVINRKKGPGQKTWGRTLVSSITGNMVAASISGKVFRTRATLDMAGKGNDRIIKLSGGSSLPAGRIPAGWKARRKEMPTDETHGDVPSLFHSRPHGGGIHGRRIFENEEEN